MPIRVSPDEQRPTHHISITDRQKRKVGLILCDDRGQAIRDAAAAFNKIPVDTTAQKQTSGSSSYNDYEYPYSPIVQDDWSGGRGNIDFERDSTKYFDAFRAKTSKANKAYAGPQAFYSTGLRQANQNMPGDVSWHQLTGNQRTIYTRFQANANYTAAMLWLKVRRKGIPGDLTITLRNDFAGVVHTELASVTIPYSRMEDTLSEWLCETISSTALTSGTYYWLVVSAAETDAEDRHWKIAVNDQSGSTYVSGAYTSTPTAYSKDMYFRVTAGNQDFSCIFFDYKEAKYFILSPTSGGAPSLRMFGDRGTADANTGQLDKLIDGTKSWVTDEWAGSVVKVIDGPGATEEPPYRTIVSNTGTQLTLDTPWKVTHSTATEYVIYGTKVTPITGHGLTATVTDVLVTTKGMILFAQGDSVNIRRAKFETSGGNWTASYADDGSNKAVFLDYMPKENKIIKANNRDSNGDVSIALGEPVEWATASHTFGTAKAVDNKYIRITGLQVYPDEEGEEAAWVFKEDLPYIVPPDGNAYPLNLEEMRTVRSERNGKSTLRHNVYMYFTMGLGLERYYSGQVDDIGPNQGEGLPENRRGAIASMVGYPGRFFIAVDAESGYSSVLESGGWHERYRAPKGQRIRAISYQVVPGNTPDRLWIYQGFDMVSLPFPSDTTNELDDSRYTFNDEFSLTLSRMHAGLFDVQKIVRKIKLQTENLSVDDTTGEPVCWFELDYRVNDNDDWIPIRQRFDTSPTQEVDFAEDYGIAGRRLQFRVRGYTSDAEQTPILLAIVVNAVIRTDVKYMYGPVNFRLMDDEPLLDGEGRDDIPRAADKQKLIEELADASTDSMLLVESVSDLFHERVVFMNTPQFRQVNFRDADDNPFKKNVYIGTVSFQEA